MAKSDFTVKFDDGGFIAASKAIPNQVAFHVNIAMRRARADHKQQLLALHSGNPGMKRFVKKGYFFRGHPKQGTQKAVDRVIRNQGPGRIFAGAAFNLPAAKLHEKGGTVTHSGEGVPILSKRGKTVTGQSRRLASGKKGKRNVAGQALRTLGKRTKSGGRVVWLRSKRTGLLSVFEVDRRARKKGSVLKFKRLATFVKETKFKPTLGFDRTWNKVQGGKLPSLLAIALERVGRDFDQFKTTGKVTFKR